MNTLVVYDDTGKVFYQVNGEYLTPQGGIQYLEAEVPDGKYISVVDVSSTPHQVILEDVPPTEIEILKQKLYDAEQVAADTSQSQQELLELLLEMGVI